MPLAINDIIDRYALQIKGLVHVGAHHGYQHNIYLKHNIKNLMYFEPVKRNYERLKWVAKNDAIIHNMALGDMVGRTSMHIEEDNEGMSCSILKPNVHLTQYPWIKFDKQEMVGVNRLDNYNIDPARYNMLIVDVQGYELEVFKGATKTLQCFDYIMTEVNRDELYTNCAKIEEIDYFLSRYGYELVENDWSESTWGDALYISRQLLLYYQ